MAQGADVINLSLGGTDVSKVLLATLKYASQQGVLIVTSTGNSGDRMVTFPASRSVGDGWKQRMVGVTSVDVTDVKSPFATYNVKRVEMAAPGEFIFTAVPDERVGYWSGTSFAAPLVTGALALALAQNDLDTDSKGLGEAVTDAVMNALYDLPGNRPYEDALGTGRLDLRLFLEEVLNED